MNSTEKKHRELAGITGFLWFALCLAGALAAIGVFYLREKLPDWSVYLELGVFGGAGAMVLMGGLQLKHAITRKGDSMLLRLVRASGFFLGIFGALLVIGSWFNLLKYPNGHFFMRIGLLGTAAALAATGLLILGYLVGGTPDENQATTQASGSRDPDRSGRWG